MSASNSFLDFRKFYEHDINLLNINGVYVPIHEMKYPKLFAIYCFLVFFPMLLILNISQYMYLLFECHNVQDFAGNAYVANICLMANIRAFFLFKQRKALKSIFDNFNNAHFQPINEEVKLIGMDSLFFFRKVKRALTMISLISTTSAITTPLFYDKNGGLPLAAWYPFNTESTRMHQLIYLHQSISVFLASMVNIETDVLTSGLFTFIGVQCDFLSYKLYNGSETNIKNYVQDYNRIKKLAKTCERIISKMFFYQYFATTTGLCMTLFLLTLVAPNTFQFFFLVVYQLSVFNLLLVPSWFSSEVRKKSEHISVAAYCYPWIDAKNRMKRDLIIFIQNTQTPIQIKALGFFNISLELFLKIVHSSFSYYTMLKKISA